MPPQPEPVAPVLESARGRAPGPGPDSSRGVVLATGFGGAAAMWSLGYFLHLPGTTAPGWLVLASFALVMLAAGYAAGRFGPRGLRDGLLGGWLAGAVNLLVLGSVWKTISQDNFIAYALLWAPGSVLATGLVAGAGAWLGQTQRRSDDLRVPWPMTFALVTAAATLVLLSVGGTVTSLEAGLAVPDWPNSYGYNMFLYPLTKMTGGIYFEHAHRLLGSLVGLTTLALMVFLVVVERRKSVRALAVVAFVLVCVQGILGGLRVTGNVTLATEGSELQPNLALAMVHGVTGQAFFALLLGLSAALAPAWFASPTPVAGTGGQRSWGAAALTLIFAQLILGALLRHTNWGLHLHITVAVLALAAGGHFGLLTWSRGKDAPLLPASGAVLAAALIAQFLLGFGALAAVTFQHVDRWTYILQAFVTTLHQTLGALVLALATVTLLLHIRLLTALREPRPAAHDPVALGQAAS